MQTVIEFKQEARNDVKDAYLWYETQRSGTGLKFEAALAKLLDRMKRMPELGEEVMTHVRKRQITPFPYFILYRVETDRLYVLGVFHYKRKPKIWMDRLHMNGNGV